MARPTSEHIPCKIQIGPFLKPKFSDLKFFGLSTLFFYTVRFVWFTQVNASKSATSIFAKFKLLRAALKKWSRNLSNLSKLISNCNSTLQILDTLEEQITLFIQEYNFRKILEDHTLKLLRYKKEYWKKRYTVGGQNVVMRGRNSSMLQLLKGTD
jgi:hypothetical protein